MQHSSPSARPQTPSTPGGFLDGRAGMPWSLGSAPSTTSAGPIWSPGASPSTPSVPSPASLARSRSLNLYHLGIMGSPLSPLLRPFSSQRADGDGVGPEAELERALGNDGGSGPDSDADRRTEDSRDVLVDRLTDLVHHLTASPLPPRYDDRTLSALHAHVDDIEAVLAAADQRESRARQERRRSRREAQPNQPLSQHLGKKPGQSIPQPSPQPSHEASRLASAALHGSVAVVPQTAAVPALTTSGWLKAAPVLMPAPQPSSTRATSPTRRSPSPAAGKVAAACEALAGDLSNVLGSLTQRSEELEHIQNLLLSQLAVAKERIVVLEAEADACSAHPHAAHSTQTTPPPPPAESTVSTFSVTDLDRLEELEAEVSFLRLQLRAIEVRCRSYLPLDADPELAQSIENWKADWAALQSRVTQERTYEQMNDSLQMKTGGLYAR